MKKFFLFACLTGLLQTAVHANNVALANVVLNGQNTTAHNTKIGFDISWENSWRTSTNESNYDGNWIFAKFRKKGTSSWLHCSLATTGFTGATGSTIKVSADFKGLWMYRSADGIGNVNWTGNSIVWNYGNDGVADADSVEIRLYATEMVFVPQGAYKLGSGGTETGGFFEGGTTAPYSVTSEASITVSNTAGFLYSGTGGYSGDKSGPIPAAFPKGFNAFWVMKYEISSQQYADFLNTLSSTQATARYGGTVSGITTAGSPVVYTATYPERAATYVGTDDLFAFLDWSAIRPFTELEYEKACRGANIAAFANEFAWGSDSYTNTTIVVNQGFNNETASNGNTNMGNSVGVVRCGIYATGTSTRFTSGATYYGAMEMTGNVYEQAVSSASNPGRAFTGANGDGLVAVDGSHNVANWNIAGISIRGGAFNSGAVYGPVSNRYYGAYGTTFGSLASSSNAGGRGARTAE